MVSRFRSLRWRLQAWYTAILFLVIAGLSSVLHWEITRSQWDHVDEELLSAARILEGSMRDVPTRILDSMSRDLASPPGPRMPPRNDRTSPTNGQPPRDDRRGTGRPDRPPNFPQQNSRQPDSPQPSPPQPNPPQPSRDSIGRFDWNLSPTDADIDRRPFND